MPKEESCQEDIIGTTTIYLESKKAPSIEEGEGDTLVHEFFMVTFQDDFIDMHATTLDNIKIRTK